MTRGEIAGRMPRFLRRLLLDFETRIEAQVERFAADLEPGARVLDAGAGECRYAAYFSEQRYLGLDLAVGDAHWNYRKLDVVADLARMPFRAGTFGAVLSIVTLEHVPDPARVMAEMARAMEPGGRLLLVVPQDWEIHQAPHDYFRFTRHGVEHLVTGAGLEIEKLEPAGGFFRLLARRLLNAEQFLPWPLLIPAAVLLTVPALLLPLADRLDRKHTFTLGYLCRARKPF